MKNKTIVAVWDYIKYHPGVTVGQVALGCRISYNTSRKYVCFLVQDGSVYYTEENYRNTLNMRKFYVNDNYTVEQDARIQ